jgi:hypothetical protein
MPNETARTDATNDPTVGALWNSNISVLVERWNQPRNETPEVEGDRWQTS